MSGNGTLRHLNSAFDFDLFFFSTHSHTSLTQDKLSTLRILMQKQLQSPYIKAPQFCKPDPGGDSSMEFPHHFRCPISLELMKDPVTISTGVTYERKHIEKWFHTYKNKTCPATMLSIESMETTPNHTLKRLIEAWKDSGPGNGPSCNPEPSSKHEGEELAGLLSTIESSLFKVSSLRKLRGIVEKGEQQVKQDFKRLGGVEALVRIMVQILQENCDFVAFRACEEAVGVLHQVPVSDEDQNILRLLMGSECMNSMAVILRRGSAEARLCAISTLQKMAKADFCKWHFVEQDRAIDFFKSLMEIVSDEICTRTSSCTLQLLVEIMAASKKSRVRAVEAGAVFTLVELLPDSGRSKCETILQLIKLLCECAEGRLAFMDHCLGLAAVVKKMVNVSTASTKAGVKILWLISSCHPSEKVLEEMLVTGAVKKLAALTNVGGGGGRSMGSDRAMRILKLHGRAWRRYPCFPADVGDNLGLGYDA